MESLSGFSSALVWGVIILISLAAVGSGVVFGWMILSEVMDVNVPQTDPKRATWAILRIVLIIMASIALLVLLVSWRLHQ